MCAGKLKYVRTISGKTLIVADLGSLKAAVLAFFEEVEAANSLLSLWTGWPVFLGEILTCVDEASVEETVNAMLQNRIFNTLVPAANWRRGPDWLK